MLIVRLRQSKFRGNVEIDGEEEKPESDDWAGDEQRDELAASQWIELHSGPPPGPIAGYPISKDQSGGCWTNVLKSYDECIGAKKHLVLILTSEADPHGSNSLGTGL